MVDRVLKKKKKKKKGGGGGSFSSSSAIPNERVEWGGVGVLNTREH